MVRYSYFETNIRSIFLQLPGQPTPVHDRIYVTVVVVQIFWEVGTPMPWEDVNLPHG